MTETPPVDFIAQANLVHENGPYVTPPSTLYFTYLRTDGDSFVGPASHAEQYLRIGYTITGEQTIDNFAAWVEEQGAREAPKTAEPAEREAHPRSKGNAA
jgi:hypothetical protein